MLLLECIPAHAEPAELRRLAGAVSDWDGLLRRANRHDLEPLLYWRLNHACPDAVPPAVLERLKSRFHENARRNLGLAGALLRLLDLFKQSRIPVFAFKGVALAWSVWESPGLRVFADLDLLVRPEHRSRAAELLQSSGHSPLLTTTDPAFYRWNPEAPFRSRDGVEIDLHWDEELFRGGGDIRPRLVSARVAGHALLAPGPRDMLIYSCVHGAKHAWSCLAWLCDLTRLLAAYSYDWDEVFRLAEEAGCYRRLLLGLSLAHEFGRAQLPNEALRRIGRDPVVAELARQAGVSVRGSEIAPKNARSQFQFQAASYERWRDKLRICLDTLRPTTVDYDSFRLSGRFISAYYLARPCRLFAKYVKTRFRAA